MLELNTDQKRNFLTSLEHVDKLLSDSEHVLDNARSPSFLPEYVCDITPEQHERLLDCIARFREMAGGLLRQNGLMREQAQKSARGAILTYLLFAYMTLEELDTKGMKNFGRLSDETARELDMTVSKMRRFIQDMRAYVDRTAMSRTM